MERISHDDAKCGARFALPIYRYGLALHERCPRCEGWACHTDAGSKPYRTWYCGKCDLNFTTKEED